MHMRHGLSYEMARLIKDVLSVRACISVSRISVQMLVYIPSTDFAMPQAVSYVELQNVQLRTIDGKEVAQLCGALTDEYLPAPTTSHNFESAVFRRRLRGL